jgi:chromate reductase, NAD(P)H dehydrogenase (quinone)
MTTLLAISGSIRDGSYNSALLRAAAAELPDSVAVRVWRGLDRIPPYNEDLGAEPGPVAAFRRELTKADAVLFATPEYNASVPGALKNALDWASLPFRSNPLRGKPVAVIGASRGVFGAVWAQAELRKILGTIGAQVEERGLVVPHAHQAFTANGMLRDPGLASTLTTIVHELLDATCRRAA